MMVCVWTTCGIVFFFEGYNKYSLLSQRKEQIKKSRLSFRKIRELEQNVEELQKLFVKPCYFET